MTNTICQGLVLIDLSYINKYSGYYTASCFANTNGIATISLYLYRNINKNEALHGYFDLPTSIKHELARTWLLRQCVKNCV